MRYNLLQLVANALQCVATWCSLVQLGVHQEDANEDADDHKDGDDDYDDHDEHHSDRAEGIAVAAAAL